MQNPQLSLQEKNIDQLFDSLKQDETQLTLAKQAEEALFTDENAKKNTAQMINTFVDDYLNNGRQQPINQWLKSRFDQYPDIWESEQEKIDTTNTIINTIESLVCNQVELEKHLNKRKTIENFYQKKINQMAETYQFEVQELAQEVDAAVAEANCKQFGFLTGEVIDVPFEEKPLNEKTIQRAKFNANLNLAFWGIKSAGSRLANAFLNKENLSYAEELQKIIRGAVDTAENKGVQIAISGGAVVSAKKGWIKDAFEGLEKVEKVVGKAGAMLGRIQDLTLNVANGWDDVRLYDKVEQGVLSATEVAAEKAKFVAAQIITNLEQKADLFLRQNGAKLGAKLGAVVGSVFGPAGTGVGSIIGGFIGEKVGGYVSDKIVKPVAETAKRVANTVIDTVKDTAKSVVSSVTSAARSVVSSVSSAVSSFFGW
ncbi:glycine zipper family protein [Aggregatibacter segnis]|uniref:glycine zipper family protein n=1 Tax=Aggregatibacter segnis TaxID=739 RepID=UPI000D686535|nr:hypothetical protein [Aggregatibacter segnis]